MAKSSNWVVPLHGSKDSGARSLLPSRSHLRSESSVLGAIDFPARPIQLPVDLPLLAPRQMPSVQLAVGADFPIDGGFIFFETGSLARAQLSRGDSGRDPVLLVFQSIVHFVFRRRLCSGVVFIVVDLAAQVVLLLIDDRLFLVGQLAAVQ